MIQFLTFDEIIYINWRTVSAHGGNFNEPNNILNEEPLRYLIEAVTAEYLGCQCIQH
ncbi:MAG TPA: hypothetical protein PKD85_19025 [Saprospiraceae bacterium]|nr:hypothetical protein [Saprospiraceae bacterium]